jgi:hypothetical protein
MLKVYISCKNRPFYDTVVIINIIIYIKNDTNVNISSTFICVSVIIKRFDNNSISVNNYMPLLLILENNKKTHFIKNTICKNSTLKKYIILKMRFLKNAILK